MTIGESAALGSAFCSSFSACLAAGFLFEVAFAALLVCLLGSSLQKAGTYT